MIAALIIGFITGWLMAMPIGPVNAAVISRTLKYTPRYGLAVGVGAAIMDAIYCGGAAQINQFLVASPVINLLFLLVGCIALIYLGIKQLRARRLAQEAPQEPAPVHTEEDDAEVTQHAMEKMHLHFQVRKKTLVVPLLMGILLYATNVAAVPEWIIVAGIWRSWGLLGVGVDINAGFAAGAGLGTLGWNVVLVRWIARRRRGFKPSTLRKINLGTGIAMLIFGAYFAYQIVFQTKWHEVASHIRDNTSGLIGK